MSGRKQHKSSLKKKIVLLVMGITSAAVFLALSVNLVIDIKTFRDDMISNAGVNSSLIAEYCIPSLTFNYPDEAKEVLYTLRKLPSVVNAAVYNKEKQFFASFERDSLNKPQYVFRNLNDTFIEDGYLHSYSPVIFENNYLGHIYLKFSTDRLSGKIYTDIITLLALILILIVLNYFLAKKFHKIISEPVLELAGATKAVTNKREYGIRLTPKGEGEIEELYHSVNEMFAVIQSRQQERDQAIKKTEALNEQLEEKVRIRTAELKKLTVAVEQSPVNIVITDKDGNIEYVNPNFEKFTGYSLEEAFGKNPRILKAPGLPDSVYKELWETIISGKTWHGDLINKKKNGEIFWESISIAPIISEDNTITNFIAVKEDITERKKNEEELKNARKAAEAANQAKSLFLANMSHELRTPLNAILGFAQILLREDNLDENFEKNLKIINRSGQHLRELINDVLEMSKIESGKTKLENKEFDFRLLLNDLQKMFQGKCESKQLKLNFEIGKTTPEFIISDEKKIRQIIINLLGNAVKFTSSGEVSLRVSSVQSANHNSDIIIEVEDTGIGIPEEELENIFKYFEQVKNLKFQEGTGLGLSICKEYTNLLGGTLDVNSEVEKGTLFRFKFRAKIGSGVKEEKEKVEKKVKKIISEKEFKILIADDRDTNRRLLSFLLKSVGFVINEAINGYEAVEIFNKWQPDLILMDMVMPEMDGFEATRIIRMTAPGKQIPIIAVTASVLDEDREKVLSAGVNDIVRKPISEFELFEAIKNNSSVKYEYKNRAKTNSAGLKFDEKSLLSVLNEQDKNLIENIRKAIETGYKKRLIELLESIKTENHENKKMLKELAKTYKFEKILELLNKSQDNSDG